jgi:hypothetical protein
LLLITLSTSVEKVGEKLGQRGLVELALALASRAHAVAPASRATALRPRWTARRGRLLPAGPCAVEPPFWPSSLAPRASHPWAAVPPYPRCTAQPTTRRRARRTRVTAPRAVLRPCRGPHLVWPQLGAKANTSTASSRPYKPSFSKRASNVPLSSAMGASR